MFFASGLDIVMVMNVLTHARKCLEPTAEYTDVDLLALCWLSYIDMEPLQGHLLSETPSIPYYQEKEAYRGGFNKRQTKSLLAAMAKSPRFQNVRILRCIQNSDYEKSVQFRAVALQLEQGVLIAYEGTDTSLTGWKEDFMMSYVPEIASYSLALSFFEEIAAECQGDLILAGHSKGGNIASYVLSKAKDASRIVRCLSYEGPGFKDEDIFKDHPERKQKLVKYIPQSAVVGVLFHAEADIFIVRSNNVSVFQHNPFEWWIRDGQFVLRKKRSLSSRYLGKSLNNWIDSVSDEEKKRFTSLAFDLFHASGLSDLMRVVSDFHRYCFPLWKGYRSLCKEDKKLLLSVLKKLASNLMGTAKKKKP